ncbi:hypothetical protein JCM4814A_67490 [Streptomyces phaeofaciens JCM 4814]|uniref:Uncharacterized protein n=1 Tax=Streptomyces phaeofaciens TaxID=68254 RepID=A0A918LRN1_9ACTN|nr:hypothetical protein [Streptomyces phaeofaciens]GGT40614.1 hypothetical protein GCM10010226_16140 [Streptomyces phaeofaciens]
MPAENEHGPAHDSYDGMDALMAALTEAPLSDEARADPGYLAAHGAAVADLAVLREQLGLLADTLTEPAPAAAPAERATAVVRPLRRPRRLVPFALRAVGVAAAGALVVGSGWLVLQAGGGASDDSGAASSADSAGKSADQEAAGSAFGDPGYLACAGLVVEGDVTAVEPVPGTADERVTLRVTRSYKPQDTGREGEEVGFVLTEDMDPLVAEGDHVLVALERGSSSPDVWTVGEADIAAERSALLRALPQAADTGCG